MTPAAPLRAVPISGLLAYRDILLSLDGGGSISVDLSLAASSVSDVDVRSVVLADDIVVARMGVLSVQFAAQRVRPSDVVPVGVTSMVVRGNPRVLGLGWPV